ncbi:retrovirus-related pol polyprotein from transposon TNT 1-94 [Tanacetum coccineum]|uniref:Retrovirus-related pol polyprotein from transposon TNT 1-94 n=1 Tax=Tanacetum coccineum TaxID=301880 RepID=A0ABQ5G5R3_9ASTR
MTHPSPKKNMVPKAVLMRSGLVSLTTAKPVNTAQPRTTVNSARPMTNVFNKAHSTVRRPINNKTATKNSNSNQRINIVRGNNVNTARPKAVLNAVKGNQGTCPILLTLKKLMEDMLPLEVTLKEGKSQAENIVPKGGLTCLFAKATSDESKLWHRRLGHINFKTMNKLVKGNLGKQHRASSLGFMRPLGCLVTILNTIDHLGKFDGKANEGFFVGYSINSKAFRVFNSRTRIVEGNLHVQFSENTPNITGYGPNWLFDIDVLTKSMNYKPAVAENQSNDNACTKACDDAVNAVGGKKSIKLQLIQNMPALEDYSIFDSSSDDQDVGAEADMNNLDAFMPVNPIPTTRVHKKGSSSEQKRPQKANSCIDGSKLDRGYEGRASTIKLQEVWTLVELPNGKWAIVEVYVCQPPIFEDPNFPGRVHKVEKALYGLHQAPRAWYETLSTYLLDNGFRRGKIDKTLFIRRDKGDILLVQMSSIGELTFFFGLQVKQKKDGIFISQDKYVAKILKKFGFSEVKTASTPMETQKPLLKDEDGEEVDVHLYRQPKLGLWYPKDSPFDLVAYTDSDYAGASLDRKSTTRGCQFLGCRLISWQCRNRTVDGKFQQTES